MIESGRQRAAPSGLPTHLVDAGAERTRRAEIYTFGAFVVEPGPRVLTLRGKAVEIGSRAFDLLVVLLRSKGEIVSKDVITRYVWPTTTVDESNLRFQMACLRRALGTDRDRVKTIPGRGYLFVGDTSSAPAWPAQPYEPPRRAEVGLLPRAAAIVIIDEDPDNREALCRLLRPIDADVQSFVSWEAFIASNDGRVGPANRQLSAIAHAVSHQLITEPPFNTLSVDGR